MKTPSVTQVTVEPNKVSPQLNDIIRTLNAHCHILEATQESRKCHTKHDD